jgi:hypothetical protein
MQRLRRNKVRLNIMATFTILLFASTVFSAGLPAGRLIPNGKVSLFNGTQKVGEYHSEAPLPDNALLSVQGECGVKLNGAYLVATDNSLFSIKAETSPRILAIEHGTVYFAIADKSLSFQTPHKMVTTNDIILSASSDNGLLKGYISVADGTAKIGVLDGGAMVLSVDDGKPIMIKSGQELLLTQADLFDLPEEGGEEAAAEAGAGAETGAAAGAVGGVSTQTALIGLGVLAVGGAAAAAGGGGGGGGGDASPSSPQ